MSSSHRLSNSQSDIHANNNTNNNTSSLSHPRINHIDSKLESITEKYSDLLNQRLNESKRIHNPKNSHDNNYNSNDNNNNNDDDDNVYDNFRKSLLYQKNHDSVHNKENLPDYNMSDDDDIEDIDYNEQQEEDDDLDYLDYTDEEEEEEEEEEQEHENKDGNISDDEEIYNKNGTGGTDTDTNWNSDYSSEYIYDSDYKDDNYDSLFPDETYFDNDNNNNNNNRKKSLFSIKRIFITISFIFLVIYFIKVGSKDTTDYSNDFTDTNKVQSNQGSLTSIQKQINNLYNELSSRDERKKIEFDEKLKIVVSQFEKNIKKLLPKNIVNFQNEINNLNDKINKFINNKEEYNNSNNLFSINNITKFQNEFVKDLEKNLPQEIPVMINNSSTMLLIPELHNYLSNLLIDLLKYNNSHGNNDQGINPDNFNHTILKYDLNKYIKEILTNEFQYIDKNFFINELNKNLQENKIAILNELNYNIRNEIAKYNSKERVGNDDNNNNNNDDDNSHDIRQKYSTILLKRLINHIYDTNQHQWEDDLDFMTYTQGTRLLKSLTSTSYANGNGATSPMELLSDIKLGSSSTYWQCSISGRKNCSFAIRFNKPIHLTKISYLHGRFTNNLHMMNSAPKRITIYVKLNNLQDTKQFQQVARENKAGESYSRDRTFIKVETYEYDLLDKRIKQQFPLPRWFIEFKPLVKSMIFQVSENYGNKNFVSLKKFIVNGVTDEDLDIMRDNKGMNMNGGNTFMLGSGANDEVSHSVPQYHYDETVLLGEVKSSNLKQPQQPHGNGNIPSFGQDEVIRG